MNRMELLDAINERFNEYQEDKISAVELQEAVIELVVQFADKITEILNKVR